MKNFDFDTHLNSFAEAWYEAHADTLTPEQMENAIDDVYQIWSNEPVKELGCSPLQYFEKMSDDELYAQFESYSKSVGVPSVLSDEMSDRTALMPKLENILKSSKNNDAIELTMAILSEMGDTKVFNEYLRWLSDDSKDNDLVTHAIEIMQENADLVANQATKLIPQASNVVRDRLSDLLVYAKPTEEGYRLLEERFLNGTDSQLYAAYLGMYGDARAVGVLKEAAKTCDYPTYLEVRNAVERLGTDFDIARDFSTDPLFIKMQGAQYGTSNAGSDKKE